MSEQIRAARLNVFTSRPDRFRVYTVLAAQAESGLSLVEGLSSLAEAYERSKSQRAISQVIVKAAAEAVDAGKIGAALLSNFQGLLPEEEVLLAIVDAAPAKASAALSRAAALLAFEEEAGHQGRLR